MKHLQKYTWAVLLLLVIPLIYSSCKKEEEAEVIASFTFQLDASDYKLVKFTNTSQNYSTVSWAFGDGTTSTEVSPEHTYTAEGDFNVSMTVTSSGGATDTYAQKITISDPNVMLTKLVGATSKSWKLLRDVSTGVFPLEVGPIDRSTIWWAVGNNNDELANRPCILNDEWTFNRDGSFTFAAGGNFWREGDGIFDPANTCGETTDMVGATGEDLSAWGDGSHHFRIDAQQNKITAIGKGAYIGYYKTSTDCEVYELTPMMQDSVTYNIVSLYDGAVDTLVIEVEYKDKPADPAVLGYWRYVLVHYDDPSQEPPIPGNKPSVGFTVDVTGLTINCTNTTTGAVTYEWNFGDGATSTAANPTHTYAGGGPYSVSLTATNTNGSSTASKALFVTSDVLTEADLQGGAWKIIVDNLTIFVGGGMGDAGWWSVPKANLDGTMAGTADDWSCMADDEFIFSAGGVYEYKTSGSARNDGWWGDPHGCIDDAAIAASAGNGPAFGSGIHSYAFTPASGGNRAIIELTNGATGAAFIGFMKGFYGGENTSSANLPNGGITVNKYEVMGYAKNGAKEYLFVTCDISVDHNGSASWSTILQR